MNTCMAMKTSVLTGKQLTILELEGRKKKSKESGGDKQIANVDAGNRESKKCEIGHDDARNRKELES